MGQHMRNLFSADCALGSVYDDFQTNQRDKGFMMNLAIAATILAIMAFITVVFFGIYKVSQE